MTTTSCVVPGAAALELLAVVDTETGATEEETETGAAWLELLAGVETEIGAAEEEAETGAAELDDAGADDTGATHLVQTVDTLVIKTVEMDDVVCVMTLPEDVRVAVIGQTVVVA